MCEEGNFVIHFFFFNFFVLLLLYVVFFFPTCYKSTRLKTEEKIWERFVLSSLLCVSSTLQHLSLWSLWSN